MNARAYKQYRQYKETQVMTASPLRLVLLCYDGAIAAIKKAQEAERERRFEVRDKEVNRASALVSELLSGLSDEGGEITKNLRALYGFVLRRLLEAAVKNEPELYDEAVNVLSDLREAWHKLAEGGVPDMNNVEMPEEAMAPASL